MGECEMRGGKIAASIDRQPTPIKTLACVEQRRFNAAVVAGASGGGGVINEDVVGLAI